MTGVEKEELTVEMLLGHDAFADFVNAYKGYSMPFINKMSQMNAEEFDNYYIELSQMLETQKRKQKQEIINITHKMGFKSQNRHDELYLKMKKSRDNLFLKFPQLQQLNPTTKKVFETALKSYFKKILVKTKIKTSSGNMVSNFLDCYATLEYCQQKALNDFMFRTITCTGLIALSPVVAIACQVANATLHSAEQTTCLMEYDFCI